MRTFFLSIYLAIKEVVRHRGRFFLVALVIALITLLVLFIAALVGVPTGFLGGVYLAEFGGSKFSFVVRYVTDLLNGVPSIVVGVFAYGVAVLPFKQFSALAGGAALFADVLSVNGRVGERNVAAARAALAAAGIPIVAEDIGGTAGRSVSFDVGSGALAVRLPIRRGITVILGCFILFGAQTIAGGIMGAAGKLAAQEILKDGLR